MRGTRGRSIWRRSSPYVCDLRCGEGPAVFPRRCFRDPDSSAEGTPPATCPERPTCESDPDPPRGPAKERRRTAARGTTSPLSRAYDLGWRRPSPSSQSDPSAQARFISSSGFFQRSLTMLGLNSPGGPCGTTKLQSRACRVGGEVLRHVLPAAGRYLSLRLGSRPMPTVAVRRGQSAYRDSQ